MVKERRKDRRMGKKERGEGGEKQGKGQHAGQGNKRRQNAVSI